MAKPAIGGGEMEKGDAKVVYVLDVFHILETMMGHERISSFTVEQALKFMDDTAALLNGTMTPNQYKKTWKLK